MKLPVLLVLVVAACAQSQPPSIDRETHYAPGSEYTYEYKGQILSGLPEVSQEFAGLKIKCNVKIQVQDKFLMELRDVQLCKIQKEIDIPTKQHAVLPDDCEDDSWTNEVREQLQKRIEFQWTKGQISQIRTTQSDPDWSVNIKRGVLELFQINLEGDEESRHLAMGSVQKYYHIMEQGVGGICESMYNVKAHVTLPEVKGNEIIPAHDVMTITKLKNYHNCKDRPTRQSMDLNDESCINCPEDRLLTQLSQARYNVTGNRKRFIIDSVIADERHIYAPFGVDNGQAVTFVDQHLIRTEVREIQALGDLEIIHSLEDMNRKEQIDGLKFVFPHRPHKQIKTETHTEECQPISSVQSPLPQIEQLLNNIVNGIDEYISEESVRHLHLLREKMMGLNSNELCLVMQHHDQDVVNDAELNKKKIILEDLLPLLGNLHSVEILSRRIKSQKIVGARAQVLVTLLNGLPNPDDQIVDTILDLCLAIETANEDYQLQKTCGLVLGSVIHKACKDENQDLCPKIKKDHYMNTILSRTHHHLPEDIRRTCLKIIGNAGIYFKNDTFDLLQKVQSIVLVEKDSETSPEIKALAIYSLRRINKKHSEEIRTILAPIYRDYSINHEVRIAAFIVIMDFHPDHLSMQILAQVLQKETSRQVGNFVYSHLKTIAEATISNKNVTSGAKEALEIAKKFAGEMKYSKSYQLEKALWNKKISAVGAINWLSTPESIFGIGGTLKLGTKTMSRNLNLLEVGYHSEHLEELVTQLFVKVLGRYPPINAKFQQQSGEPSNELRDLIKRMDTEVNVTKRHPKTQPISGSVSIRAYGQDLRDFHFDKIFIEDFLAGRNPDLHNLEEALSIQKQHVNYQRVMVNHGGWKMWPTMLGIPLSLNMSTIGMVSLQATGKAEMQPRMQDVLANDVIKAKKIEISGVINPKLAHVAIGKLGVSVNHNMKAGIALESITNISAIINGNVKLNMTLLKLESSVQLPQHDHTVMSVKAKPYTFTIKGEEMPKKPMLHTTMTPQQIEIPSNQEVKRVINPTKLIEMKAKIGDKTVVAEVSTGHVPFTNCRLKPTQCLIAGPMNVSLKLLPGINRPEELKVIGRIVDWMATPEQTEIHNHITRIREHIDSHSQSSSESGSRSFMSAKTFQDVMMPVDEYNPVRQYALPTAKPESLEERLSKENFDWNAYWTREDLVQQPASIDDIDSIPDQPKLDCPRLTPLKAIFLNITAKGDLPQRELLTSIILNIQNNNQKEVTIDIISDIKHTEEQARIDEQNRLELEHLHSDPLNAKNGARIKILTEQEEQRQQEIEENRMVVCVDGLIEWPEIRVKNQHPEGLLPPHLADDMQVKYKVGLQYGKSCEQDKKIKILARATKSKQQLNREASRQLSVNERQCEQDRQHGDMDSWACQQVIEEHSKLQSLHVDATSKLDQYAERVIELVGNSVVRMLSRLGEVTDIGTVNTPHKMTASIDLDTDNFNVSVIAPLRNLKAKRCQLPNNDIKLAPVSMTTPVAMALATQVFIAPKPNCKITSQDKIVTFDNITYDYELSKCHHIVTKDCSPDNLFLVLARKQAHGRPEKETVIHLAGHKIEIIPVVNGLQVNVDGVDMHLEPMDSIIMRRDGTMEKENVQSCKRPTLMDILRPDIEENGITSSEVYRILTHKHRHRTLPPVDNDQQPPQSVSHESVSWSMDSTSSEEVIMRESEKGIWRIAKKGMKSILDGNDQRETMHIMGMDDQLRTDDGYEIKLDGPSSPPLLMITRTSKSVMLYDPLLKLLVSTCGENIHVEVPRYFKDIVCGICGRLDNEVKDEFQGPSKEIYKQPKQFALSYQLQSVPGQCVEACVPRMTIHQKDEHIDNIESICYSKVLVPQCKQPCRAAEIKRVKIDFVCVPRNSGGSLNEDIQEHRYNEVVRDLSKKPTSFVEEIEIHTRCQQ